MARNGLIRGVVHLKPLTGASQISVALIAGSEECEAWRHISTRVSAGVEPTVCVCSIWELEAVPFRRPWRDGHVTPLSHYTVMGTSTFVATRPGEEKESDMPPSLNQHLSAFIVYLDRAPDFGEKQTIERKEKQR